MVKEEEKNLTVISSIPFPSQRGVSAVRKKNYEVPIFGRPHRQSGIVDISLIYILLQCVHSTLSSNLCYNVFIK